MQYKQSSLLAQKHWLEPLLFRQLTKVVHLLTMHYPIFSQGDKHPVKVWTVSVSAIGELYQPKLLRIENSGYSRPHGS